MTTTLEMQLGVISVDDAIKKYFEHHPNDILTKLQLAQKAGPFYKYGLKGNDGTHQHSFEFNARTGDIIKNTVKDLKAKYQDPVMRETKKLNLENRIPLTEINSMALSNVPVSTPVQWELDRKRERTLWKVEITDERGANMHEVKIDAQDGALLQVKLKH